MHIPDGYLSPATCALFYAGMAPVWFVSARKAERALKLKQLPLLSFGAAFAFVIMMFNIPVPGGTSGHMAATTLMAIILGPWAAVIALTLALSLQAFFFGDGGITTLAANCFNMAALMSFGGYYTYRLISAGAKPLQGAEPPRGDAGRLRRVIASAIGAYVAVNIAAFAAAMELGIQPLVAADALGRPLYAPYPLSIALPAMMIPHLLIFGPVEAFGTALAVSFIHRTDSAMLHAAGGAGGSLKPLWILLAIMIILTPLGLVATGTPWGEWGKGELAGLVGYVPAGMHRLGEMWTGVMPSYGIKGLNAVFGERLGSVAGYVIAATAGSAGVILAVYLWGRIWRK
ncbi:MAG: cobalt transporter CbiM [Deltaproteobacteria bacterium]|nr:cobalt transporter CbiM [Deltaproteobacteria bacterium]